MNGFWKVEVACTAAFGGSNWASMDASEKAEVRKRVAEAMQIELPEPKWMVVRAPGRINIDKVHTGDRLTIEGTSDQCKALAERVAALLNDDEG